MLNYISNIIHHGNPETIATPCYFYDIDLLNRTLAALNEANSDNLFHVHYAMKANFNPEILKAVRDAGCGVDTVSGGEIKLAIESGFAPEKIVFAGVGKRDDEIKYALEHGIGCFNVESMPELENINRIACEMGRVASVCLRLNPGIDAHTHKYITTGLAENKFGMEIDSLEHTLNYISQSPWLRFIGLHFHIGSQITINKPFELLCNVINSVVAKCIVMGCQLKMINIGGGLGIDYENPDTNPIANFKGWLDTFRRGLRLPKGVEVHCEPGRALVAQCGSLLTRVLYVKEGVEKRFAILDAGFTELIRPVLYNAYHRIDIVDRKQSGEEMKAYDVVGPICESTDTFAEDIMLPTLTRGDLLAIRSAGAYGESMSSHYNCRSLFPAIIKK